MSESDLEPSDAGAAANLHHDAHQSAPSIFLAERFIRSPDGHVWQVGERRPTSAGTVDYHALVFVAEHAMRRVRNFPANWRELSDAQLYEVSLLV